MIEVGGTITRGYLGDKIQLIHGFFLVCQYIQILGVSQVVQIHIQNSCRQ